MNHKLFKIDNVAKYTGCFNLNWSENIAKYN